MPLKSRRPRAKDSPAVSSAQSKGSCRNEEGVSLPASQKADSQVDWTPFSELFTKYRSAVIVWILLLPIYLYTVHPSVPGGDAGELIAVAHDLGLAHPPGYPLFTLMGFVANNLIPASLYEYMQLSDKFSQIAMEEIGSGRDRMWNVNGTYIPLGIPLGSLSGWKLNVMNAGIGALAAGTLAAVCEALGAPVSAGVLCGLQYGLSPLVWTYTITAEVFALNNLFAALLLYLSVAFYNKKGMGIGQTGAFICGLALTNQHTAVLFIAPIVIYVLSCVGVRIYEWPSRWKWQRLWKLAGWFLLGLSPYLYLMWSSNFHTSTLNYWGKGASTPTTLLRHFLRADYGTFQLANKATGRTKPSIANALYHYVSDYITNEVSLSPSLSLSPLLSVVGGGIVIVSLASVVYFVFLRREERERENGRENESGIREPIMVILMCWVVYFLVFHSLANLPLDGSLLYRGVVMRFWMQPNTVIAVLTGIGFGKLIGFLFGKNRKFGVQILIFSAILGIAALQVSRNWNTMNMRENFAVEKYGRAILQPMPENAMVLIRGDLNINSVRYLQTCERFRADVSVLDMENMVYPEFNTRLKAFFPHITIPGQYYKSRGAGSYSIRDVIASNIAKRRVFKCGEFRPAMVEPLKLIARGDTSYAREYTVRPYGLCDEIIPLEADIHPSHHLENGQKLQRAIGAWESNLLKWVDEATQRLPTPVEFLGTWEDVNVYADDTWDTVVVHDYWESYNRIATYLLLAATTPPNTSARKSKGTFVASSRILKRASEEYERLIDGRRSYYPSSLPEGERVPMRYHLNAGISFYRLYMSEAPRTETTRQKLVEHYSSYLRIGENELEVKEKERARNILRMAQQPISESLG